MNIQFEIEKLKARKSLLEARGSHNARLINKVARQIRKKEKEYADQT